MGRRGKIDPDDGDDDEDAEDPPDGPVCVWTILLPSSPGHHDPSPAPLRPVLLQAVGPDRRLLLYRGHGGPLQQREGLPSAGQSAGQGLLQVRLLLLVLFLILVY